MATWNHKWTNLEILSTLFVLYASPLHITFKVLHSTQVDLTCWKSSAEKAGIENFTHLHNSTGFLAPLTPHALSSF